MKRLLRILLISIPLAFASCSQNTEDLAPPSSPEQLQERRGKQIRVEQIPFQASQHIFDILPDDKRISVQGNIVEATVVTPLFTFYNGDRKRLVIFNESNFDLHIRLHDNIFAYGNKRVRSGIIKIPKGKKVVFKEKKRLGFTRVKIKDI